MFFTWEKKAVTVNSHDAQTWSRMREVKVTWKLQPARATVNTEVNKEYSFRGGLQTRHSSHGGLCVCLKQCVKLCSLSLHQRQPSPRRKHVHGMLFPSPSLGLWLCHQPASRETAGLRPDVFFNFLKKRRKKIFEVLVLRQGRESTS